MAGQLRRSPAKAATFFSPSLGPDEHLETPVESDLPDDWDTFPHSEATRALGIRWFEEERSVVLAVPSAILPVAKNYLINSFHPDVHELERGDPVPFSWNARLFRRTGA